MFIKNNITDTVYIIFDKKLLLSFNKNTPTSLSGGSSLFLDIKCI